MFIYQRVSCSVPCCIPKVSSPKRSSILDEAKHGIADKIWWLEWFISETTNHQNPTKISTIDHHLPWTEMDRNWRQSPAFPGTPISSHISIVGEIPIVDGHIPMFVGCLGMWLSTPLRASVPRSFWGRRLDNPDTLRPRDKRWQNP